MIATTPAEDLLLTELKAARRALRKLKSQFNQYDEGRAIASSALSRANKVLSQFRQPVALPLTGLKS